MYKGLGQAGMLITSAAINSALDVYSARKFGKMQAKFEKQLASDAVKMEYVRFLVDRFRTLNEMLISTTDADPHSIAYQAMLKQGMADYMKYEGDCKTTILDPTTKKAVVTITKDGRVENSVGMPPEVGIIWATGCKNAIDFARASAIQENKDETRFNIIRKQTEDIGTKDLLVRFGLGLLVFAAVIIAIRMQRKVIKSKKKPRRGYN